MRAGRGGRLEGGVGRRRDGGVKRSEVVAVVLEVDVGDYHGGSEVLKEQMRIQFSC